MTTLAIMQPYFLPYIGYFQLIAAADRFVIYDNIKYTKKGWINRNRLLKNGGDSLFSLPLQQGSDALDVCDRSLSTCFDRAKLLNQFRESYRRAPQFEVVWPVLERVVMAPGTSLYEYIHNAVVEVCSFLAITTPLIASSSVAIDHSLKAQDKVIAICEALGATRYINPIGGLELYSADAFAARGIELSFLRSDPIEYAQFSHPFVPWLSIVDVMMFNSVEAIRDLLHRWTPVSGLVHAH